MIFKQFIKNGFVAHAIGVLEIMQRNHQTDRKEDRICAKAYRQTTCNPRLNFSSHTVRKSLPTNPSSKRCQSLHRQVLLSHNVRKNNIMQQEGLNRSL